MGSDLTLNVRIAGLKSKGMPQVPMLPSNQYHTAQGQNCGIVSPMAKVLLSPSRMSMFAMPAEGKVLGPRPCTPRKRYRCG